jgi:hypothetical protein
MGSPGHASPKTASLNRLQYYCYSIEEYTHCDKANGNQQPTTSATTLQSEFRKIPLKHDVYLSLECKGLQLYSGIFLPRSDTKVTKLPCRRIPAVPKTGAHWGGAAGLSIGMKTLMTFADVPFDGMFAAGWSAIRPAKAAA